jgi:mono/diheme cytochrome c family protein
MRQAIVVLALLSLALPVACTKQQPAEPVDTPEPVATAEPDIDQATGFKMTGDWELVRGNCTACHSAKLITQQRGTAQQWLAMIRWMQKKQNLWQFDPGTESRIIAYLSENYPPEAAQRRAAIPPDLMPPNPYSTETYN